VQLQVTDMQQALRIAQWDIARYLREAGRGGLKADLEPGAVFADSTGFDRIHGRAIEVRNNVTGDEIDIARGVPGSPDAFEGTDILIVRGCFANQLFQINPATFDADSDNDDSAGDDNAGGPDNGQVVLTIPPVSVAGVPQPFAGDEIEQAGGTVLLGSYLARDDWGVGTIVGTPAVNGAGNLEVTLQLNTNSPLNPRVPDSVPTVRTFPLTMAVTQACLLEEYRYYIHDVREASDPITPLRPRLTRARFEPGTETPYQGLPANYELDLADQIFDLQVALSLDTDYSGAMDDDSDDTGTDDELVEADADSPAPGRGADDWLYNDPLDTPLCDPYDAGCTIANEPYLYHNGDETDPVDVYFVRVTTAARTARPDAAAGSYYAFRASDLDTRTSGDWLEDHNYDDPGEPSSVFNDEDNRKHRRRTLTTVVEMRNI
jgi:hypothetical protein